MAIGLTLEHASSADRAATPWSAVTCVNGGGKHSHVAAQYTATLGIGHGRWEMARALARALSG
jgi:hypothetical protein